MLYLEWSAPDLTVIVCRSLCLQCVRRGIYCISDPCLLCVRPHSHGLYQPVSAVYQTSQSWSVPTLVYCVSDLTVIICTNLCLQCVRPHSNFTNLCLLCVRRHSNCLYQPVSAVSDVTVSACTNLCLRCVRPHSNCLYHRVSAVCQTSQ